MPTCPPSYNFTIFCGTLFTRVFTFYNPDGTLQNLTGKGFVLAAKRNSDDPDNYFEFSTNNGRAVNGGAAGTITITSQPADTEDLLAGQLSYVSYFINSGVPQSPIFQGEIALSQAALPSGG